MMPLNVVSIQSSDHQPPCSSSDVMGARIACTRCLAAARALLRHASLSATEISREALQIAGEICVYTNANVTVLSLEK